MSVREGLLSRIYFELKSVPGWLAKINVGMKLTPEEFTYLEELDDLYMATDTAIAKWMNATNQHRRWGIFGLDTDDEVLALLSKNIAEAYRDYEDMAQRDDALVNRVTMLLTRAVAAQEGLRRKIRAGQIHRSKPTDDPSDSRHVSDYQIAKAREYPLENLISNLDIDQNGYIVCLWHDDSRPSMLVKNGFGYCFACQKSVDSIKWLMEIERLTFYDAVTKLCGGLNS